MIAARKDFYRINPEARAILLQASADTGIIYRQRGPKTYQITIAGKNLIPSQRHSDVCPWIGAINGLRKEGFIADVTLNGSVACLTFDGFRLAEKLLA